MTNKQRTKLELIRIEGIGRMLLQRVEEDRLIDLVASVTKATPQNIKKAIFRLPRYQLIQIIERASDVISSEDIDNAYEQYRYGLKPGFTLFSINKKCKVISEAEAYRSISEKLNCIHYEADESIKSITPKAHAKISASVVEYSFYYLNKHSYLDEHETPAFVYEYEECFAWIDIKNAFLAIKNAPEKVLTILKRALSETYETQMTNIKLTKKLIHDIFGDENIKRGSFIKPNASDNEAEKITVSDSRFSAKQAIQESISSYNMTGTYLNETVGENQDNTLGINCDKGRVYLTSNVSATVFREWSVQRITSIISYLSSNADYSDFSVFQAKNVMDFPMWAEFSIPQKKLLEQVCYSAYVASCNKQDSAPLNCSVLELKNSMKAHFYNTLLAYCDQCDEPFFPHCSCGASNLSVTRDGKIFCAECGSFQERIFCEVGHENKVANSEDIICLYPTYDMIQNIAQTLKKAFDITLSGNMYIHNGHLTLLAPQNGGLVLASAIPELQAIFDTSLSQSEYDTTLQAVQGIKEKCRKTANKNCNTCTLTDNPTCLMKIFSTNPTYRPSPHQAGEFGDVNFSVTLNGQSCELVGVAKSAQNEKDVLNLSEPPAREMLQQILTATHDARIGIIAAICPMRFHDQLVEELRYLAKLTGKPIVILDDMFMAKQYKVYLNRMKKKNHD